MTTYTIALTFDSEGARALYALQKAIAERCGNRFVVDNKMPPHITMAMFSCERAPLGLLGAFAKQAAPAQVELLDVGLFAAEKSTIYARAAKGEGFLSLHRGLCESFAQAADSFDKFYIEPLWVPHVTLALYLSEGEREEAERAAREAFHPMTAQGVALSLVAYPYAVLEGYPLKHFGP